MNGKIYKITNKINGKMYIGQTRNSISTRFSEHRSQALRGSKNSILYNAIRKYGIDNFEITLLEDHIELESLDEREIYYISEYKSNDGHTGYNLTSGGGNGFVMSEEVCRKASERMLGYKPSQESIDKMKETKRKYPYIPTDEYREKQRILSTGRKHSKETIEKRVSKMLGQKRTAEQRLRMRNAALGNKHTEEQKQKLSSSLKEGYLDRLHPFELYKDGVRIGTFLRQKDFLKPNYIINYRSLNRIMNGKLESCNGITGRKLDITIREFLENNTPTPIPYK